ncbi:DUF7507 domain-containing protein, partial [Alkalibacter mobilis]|uniref:DUF7507 domain-containing protein n=1 Tax=Alkalibacter mobilis TaxID=2787712 RepID=UPI00189DC323
MYSNTYIGKKSKARLAFIVILIMLVQLLAPGIARTAPVVNSLTPNSYGIAINNYSSGWTTGNVGKTYEEGEWVSFQLIIDNPQWDGPAELAKIGCEFSFYGGYGAIFFDMIRNISVSNRALTDTEGFPDMTGVAYPITDLGSANIAQNENNEYFFADFEEVVLTEAEIQQQINVSSAYAKGLSTDSVGTRWDATRAWFVTLDQIKASAPDIVGDDPLVIYFQMHLARTSLWNYMNDLDKDPLTPDVPLINSYTFNSNTTAKWGGYQYTPAFLEGATVPGAGNFSNGAPSNSQTLIYDVTGTSTGAKTLPLPAVAEVEGMLDGYKYDNEGNPLEGWEITLRFDLYDIPDLELKTTTDSNGYYRFDHLIYNLIYEVTEVQKDGYLQVYPILGQDEEGMYLDPSDPSYSRDYSHWKVPWDIGNDPSYGNELEGDQRAPVGWSVKLALPDNLMQHNVNFGNLLAAPELSITKSGDTLSKTGDTVNYTFVIENTGNIPLSRTSVNDDVLGDLTSLFPAELAVGATETVSVSHVVTETEGAEDELTNTVTAIYATGVTGITSVTATDTHTVQLVHPDYTLTKVAAPTIGAEGAMITYTITIQNTGDVQLNLISATDTLFGDVASQFPATLAVGADATVITMTRAIQSGDPDPVDNIITTVYQVEGLPNQLTRSDSASVDVVHPALSITKSGDALSKTGDTVNYTFVIENTGDIELTRTSVIDDVLGDLTDQFPATLAAGGQATVTASHVVTETEGAEDELTNIVTAIYATGVTGITSVTATDTHTVQLVHPDYTLTKVAAPTIGAEGAMITYTITIQNTGDVQLNLISATDTLFGDVASQFPATLAVGADATVITMTRAIQSGDPDPVDNIITTVYQVEGLPNQLTRSDSASVDVVHPALSITKSGDTLSKTGDTVNYTFVIENTGDIELTRTSVIDDVLGDLTDQFPATLAAGGQATVTASHVVTETEGAEDELTNTVTAIYATGVTGITSVTATDTHT